jgi:hypothetical protein
MGVQNSSHFHYEMNLTKTVHPLAYVPVNATVNSENFSCLDLSAIVLHQLKTEVVFIAPK